MINFKIIYDNFSWVNGNIDDPNDLCLHGKVTVILNKENLSYNCCTSASALRMLRTLKENHKAIPDTLEQMLPCCGMTMWPDDNDTKRVLVLGCTNGIDYAVEHKNNNIVITTESKNTYEIPFYIYKSEVLKFAHAVEDFYNSCTPKILPDNEFERKGYELFWSEWKRRISEW